MNTDIKLDLRAREETRHSYLNVAKKFLRSDNPQMEFFIDLVEREQRGIDKILEQYPQ